MKIKKSRKTLLVNCIFVLGLCLSLVLGVVIATLINNRDNDNNDSNPATESFVNVSNVSELSSLATSVNSGETNYAIINLTSDIVLEEGSWTPMGTADHPFEGIILGNGYKISGVTDALFYIVNDATITNLNIEANGVMENRSVLMNQINGNVYLRNVNISGDVKCNGVYAYYATRSSVVNIVDCTNNANNYNDDTISGNSAGGFMAYSYGITNITGCTNNGNITTTISTNGAKAAGFIAVNNYKQATFTNCVNNGNIKIEGIEEMYAGGFCGWINSSSQVDFENCVNNGNIYGERNECTGNTSVAVGGLVGTYWTANGTLKNVTNNGNVTAINNASIRSAHAGGLIGIANPDANVTIEGAVINCAIYSELSNEANTTHNEDVGGLIGHCNTATILIKSATISENTTITAKNVNTPNLDALLGYVIRGTITVEAFENNSGVVTRYTVSE